MSECVNMQYFFNVSYFDKLKDCSFEKIKDIDLKYNNKVIENYEYETGDNSLELMEALETAGANVKSFSLSTMYPGLLIGTGNAHDIKAKEGIKVGFSFDYVTGLPIIPGSSVKGVLRSYFPQKENSDKDLTEYESELVKLLKELTKETLDWRYLEEDIFNNNDVFLGAYPVITDRKKILARDYITPHKDPLKDPVPITMLKVRPGIEYKFLFILNDSDDPKKGLDVEEKKELFKDLLLLGGIGAKTNVGYGVMEEIAVKSEQRQPKEQVSARKYPRTKGKVKSLKNGFGFITPEEEGNDVFFHKTACTKVAFNDLKIRDTVYFEEGPGRDGKPAAVKVYRSEN